VRIEQNSLFGGRPSPDAASSVLAFDPSVHAAIVKNNLLVGANQSTATALTADCLGAFGALDHNFIANVGYVLSTASCGVRATVGALESGLPSVGRASMNASMGKCGLDDDRCASFCDEAHCLPLLFGSAAGRAIDDDATFLTTGFALATDRPCFLDTADDLRKDAIPIPDDIDDHPRTVPITIGATELDGPGCSVESGVVHPLGAPR
jgi:hypothetical protein